MKSFNYKRRNFFSIGPHLLGLMFIAVGLVALVSPAFIKNEGSVAKPYLVGTGAMLGGLMLVSSYTGTLLNFEEKKVKEYSCFCGFKKGKWVKLPAIIAVKVIVQIYHATNTPNGVSPTFSGSVTVYKTVLFSNGTFPVLSFAYEDKERAIKYSRILAANLNATLELEKT